MKQLEFKTSKGEFVLVDGIGEDFAMDLVHIVLCDEWFIKLSDVTEEQASYVVDCYEWSDGFKIYHDYSITKQSFNNLSAIESLHSLIKSQGVYLYENPAPILHHSRLEQETNTFYNPYIFKKI